MRTHPEGCFSEVQFLQDLSHSLQNVKSETRSSKQSAFTAIKETQRCLMSFNLAILFSIISWESGHCTALHQFLGVLVKVVSCSLML